MLITAVALSQKSGKQPYLKSNLLTLVVIVYRKLDWDEEEDDEYTKKKMEKFKKIVVLKHMFTIEELQVDLGGLLIG
jgi:hypothetical protein